MPLMSSYDVNQSDAATISASSYFILSLKYSLAAVFVGYLLEESFLRYLYGNSSEHQLYLIMSFCE